MHTEDRLLKIAEAADVLGTTEDWLYRNHNELPFTVWLSPRQLRFSSLGIAKYIAERSGKKLPPEEVEYYLKEQRDDRTPV